MKRRSRASGTSGKTRPGKTVSSKHRKAPKALRRGASSAVTQEVARLTRELHEALGQQAATSEVLRVISSSPGDLQSVFEAILENAVRICDAMGGGICRWDGNALHHVALKWAYPAFAEFLMRTPIHPNPKTSFGRMLTTKKVVHVPDLAGQPAYTEQREPGIVTAVEVGHIRTALYVPMLKGSELIGAFTIGSEEVRPFTEKQIELVTTFADQAVIAIENTRLLNELRQRTADLSHALEGQTATSDVLRVISSSQGELQPVFESMLTNATRLCSAELGILTLVEGDAFRIVAWHGIAHLYAREPVIRPGPLAPIARAAAAKDFVHIIDLAQDASYQQRDPPVVVLVEKGGVRSLLLVPMLKEGQVVGTLSVYRREVQAFTDKQIALLQNFAAQAVIAIENARLLAELRQRTDDLSRRTADLTEALEQQTATAEVLKVISSSPGKLEPVFTTILEKAIRICNAKLGGLYLYHDGKLRTVAAADEPEFFARTSKCRLGPSTGRCD